MTNLREFKQKREGQSKRASEGERERDGESFSMLPVLRFVFLWMGCQMSAWMETVRSLEVAWLHPLGIPWASDQAVKCISWPGASGFLVLDASHGVGKTRVSEGFW